MVIDYDAIKNRNDYEESYFYVEEEIMKMEKLTGLEFMQLLRSQEFLDTTPRSRQD